MDPAGFESCACTIPKDEVEARMRKSEERDEQEGRISTRDREELKRINERTGTAVVIPGDGE